MVTEMRTQPSPPAVDATAGVSLEVVTSRERLASLEPRWNPLVEASSSPNVFLTWEWTTTWMEHLAGSDDLHVVVVRDPETDETVGIAPFLRQDRPRGGPTLWSELVLMGCTVATPDHLDCIAREGWEGAVSRSVGDWLLSRDRGRDWHLLRLEGMKPDSGLARVLLERTGSRATATWEVPCPFTPLPGRWEAFEASLDGKFRRDLNRRIRKLEDEAGRPVSLTTVTGEDDVPGALSDLVRLHGSEGSGGAFDTPDKRRFYHDLARRFARQGWLRLHLLRVGERSIAAALCFHFGGKAWFYQTGFDRGWYRYSPGHVVIRHAIRHAIEEGAREFDMLRGDHGYKYDWNAESRSILKMRLGTSTLGGVVVLVAGWLREGKERWKAWRGTR